MRALHLGLLLVATACSSSDPPATIPLVPVEPAWPAMRPATPHPRDDTLRLHEIQVKSTHNSYHLEKPDNDLVDWAYSHLPLPRQLDEQGVRHLELDLRRDPSGVFEVYHLPLIDEETTCRRFAECLDQVAGWSWEHPGHLPVVIQLELKDELPPGGEEAYLEALHAEIEASVHPEQLITPDEIRGDAASLHEVMAAEGWPTLDAVRGRILFTLDDAGEKRRVYTRDGTSLAGRLLFAAGAPGDPFAAVAVVNDPISGADAIAAAVAGHLLVRTRADAGVAPVLEGDATRREAALASGAHFVTTDFPGPVDEHDYVLEIPGGTPARCNPANASSDCTAAALEDPSRLGPAEG